MNSREIVAEYRLSQWAQIIQTQRLSGETIKEFCQNNGIGRDAFFYWKRKLRETACGQISGASEEKKSMGLMPSQFAEVKLENARERATFQDDARYGRIRVDITGIRIIADEAYPPAQLTELLKGLMASC